MLLLAHVPVAPEDDNVMAPSAQIVVGEVTDTVGKVVLLLIVTPALAVDSQPFVLTATTVKVALLPEISVALTVS